MKNDQPNQSENQRTINNQSRVKPQDQYKAFLKRMRTGRLTAIDYALIQRARDSRTVRVTRENDSDK
jgi:hypothetical protein